MPTLLQINSVVNKGSTGRIAEKIGRIAIENGWQSYIAYGRHDRESESTLIKIGNDIHVKYHALQTRLFDRHGLASKNSTKKLIAKIKEIQPDVIHLHNLHGYYLNIEILFSFLTNVNIPVVWTLHDCWPITGHCAYFDFIGCKKWKSACFACPQKQSYPSSILLDRSKRNYISKKTWFNSVKNMTIVTVSSWLNNIVKDSFLSKYPTQVIYNGVDTKIFHPCLNNTTTKKYKLSDKFIILGVASVWDQRKGLADFLILNEHLDSKYKIILVGLNSNQIKSLPKNILGIAKTESKEELAALYSCADVFFNPSVEETFGLTTVEALSCGTPAIVYNVTASPELITPETGFVVEKGDLKELIKTIRIINKNGKQSYSSACRLRAERNYNENDRYLEYLNLYNSLMN